jgi:hypothetical protein
MDGTTPVFDMDTLSQTEEAYSARLEQEPGDTGARLSLAWCLIIKALHRAGEEKIVARLVSAVDGLDEETSRQIQAALAPEATLEQPERDARALLKSSLHQAVMVVQLSRDPREKRDAEKLRALVHLSGGRQMIQESDDEAKRVLEEITQALLNGWDEDKIFGTPLQS